MFGTNRLCACTTLRLFPHSLCVYHTLLPLSLTHCPAFYHFILFFVSVLQIRLSHPSQFMSFHSSHQRQRPTVITSVISQLMTCAIKKRCFKVWCYSHLEITPNMLPCISKTLTHFLQSPFQKRVYLYVTLAFLSLISAAIKYTHSLLLGLSWPMHCRIFRISNALLLRYFCVVRKYEFIAFLSNY